MDTSLYQSPSQFSKLQKLRTCLSALVEGTGLDISVQSAGWLHFFGESLCSFLPLLASALLAEFVLIFLVEPSLDLHGLYFSWAGAGYPGLFPLPVSTLF